MAFLSTPSAYNPNKLGAGLNALAQGSVPNTPSTPTPSQLSLGSQPQPRSGAVPMGLMNTPQAATPPTSSQQSYMQNLSQQVTAQPVAAQQTAPQTATPQSQGSYPGQLTTAQIAAEAQARIDKQRAGLVNAVTGAKTGAKNTYDYTQGLQKDNRVLEDASFQRNNNPFSGGTDYKAAMLSRDRQIADTASSKDYNNTIAGYDAQVASFDTLAPAQQQAAVDELTRIERQYGIDLSAVTGQINGGQTLAAKTAQQNYDLGLSQQSGQLPGGTGQTLAAKTADQNYQLSLGGLTGNVGGQQTLAAKQQTYNQDPNNPTNQGQVLNNQNQTIQNQLAQYQLANYPAEAKAKATLLEQQVKSGTLSNEAAAYNLQQLKDPKSAVNQAQTIDLQLKQLDLKNAPETARLKLQQLQKEIAQIGVVHYKPQTAAEAEYDQQQVIKIKAEIEKIKGGTSSSPKVDPKLSAESYAHYKDQIDNSSHTKEEKLAFAASVKNEMTDSDYANLVKGIK